MKLVHPEMLTVLQFLPGAVNSLVIENPTLFYQLISELVQQSEGKDGSFVLSKDDLVLDIAKKTEVVTDLIRFDINSKSLLTKIVSTLEKEAVSPNHYEKNQMLLSEIEGFVYELAFSYDIDLTCEKMNIGAILKALGIRLVDDYETLAEKIFSWMSLVREFEGDKLFVFVNLRSVLSETEVQAFIDTVVSHDYSVLLLDNYAYPKLTGEVRLIIDKDLCEI